MSEIQSEAARIVGRRIRETRLALGLTMEELAALAEMHWTNVGRIERGQANPNLITIVRLAGALNRDPADFITGLTLDDLPTQHHRVTAKDLIEERRRRDGDAPKK